MTKTASVEIHQINVSQSDSVLIINRDVAEVERLIRLTGRLPPAQPIDHVPFAVQRGIKLYGSVKSALLIDGGSDEYGGDVYDYMRTHGVIRPGHGSIQENLNILVSHYHDDHQAGLRYIFKERVAPGFKNDKVTYKARTPRPGVIYRAAVDTRADSATWAGGGLRDDFWEAGFSNPSSKLVFVYPGGLDVVHPFGKSITIPLGTTVDGLAVTVYLLAAGQCVYNRARNVIDAIPTRRIYGVDQNDLSQVAVLEYGSFRCFLGGDIGGNGGPAGGNLGSNAAGSAGKDKKKKKSKKKQVYSQHADVESVVGPALEAFFPATGESEWVPDRPKFRYPGYCTVMKADHHGSSSSNDVNLLRTLRPLLLLISSGIKPTPYGHPTQQVIDRASTQTPEWGEPLAIANTINQIYITEVAATKGGATLKRDLRGARIMGDIVVRPIDESVLAVQRATAKGTELTVQVYGSGVTTALTDPADKLREVTTDKPADDEIKPYYRVGPWEHSDEH